MSRRNNQTELPVVMESLRGSLPSEVTIRAAFCPFHFSCRLTLQKQMQGATTSIKQRCLCKKDDANLYYTANINHLFSVLKSSLCNHCVAKHIHPHQQFAGCRWIITHMNTLQPCAVRLDAFDDVLESNSVKSRLLQNCNSDRMQGTNTQTPCFVCSVCVAWCRPHAKNKSLQSTWTGGLFKNI